MGRILAENDIQIDTDCDINENPELARQYGIRSIPTIVILDDEGAEIKRLIGAISKEELLKELKK
jgi:thioredoxin-related protein